VDPLISLDSLTSERASPRTLAAATVPIELVERTALMAHLDRARAGRVSIIQAPAGYGKSVLLRTWARKLQRDAVDVVSIDADEELAEPGRFLAALITTLADLNPRARGALRPALSELPSLPPRSAIRRFVEMLRDRDRPLVVIIDDYARASHDELDVILGELLRRVPARIHFAIATRTQFHVPLGELWLDSNATAFTAQQLRLTDEEISLLFNHRLDPESLARISVWTEGWPVAVALAHHHLSTARNEAGRLGRLLAEADGDIGRYLMDQMVQRLPEQHRELLIQTSFLDPISDELVEAVTGRDGARRILQDLERSNVLIAPMDDTGTWYRCHHLLRGVLFGQLRRRGQRELARLQLLASRWYQANGNLRDAIRSARDAADFHLVAQLILQAGGIFYGVRYGGPALRALLEQLPPEFVSEYPRLSLARVLLLCKEGRFDTAADIIRDVRQRLTRPFQLHSDARDPLLLRDLAFSELARSLYCGFYIRVEDLSIIEKAVAEASVEDYWLRGLLNNLLCVVHYRQADFHMALSTAELAHYYYAQACSSNGVGHMYLRLGQIHLELADVKSAIEHYRAARNAFVNSLFGDDAGCAMADVMLAEALYEQGLLSKARALCASALTLVESGESYYELLVAGYRTVTALTLAAEGPQAAIRALGRALGLTRRRRFVDVERYLLLRRLELELEGGEHAGVETWPAPSPLLPNGDGVPISWRERDLKMILDARLLLTLGDRATGLDSLKRLQETLAQQGRVRSRIVALVELALAHEMTGNRSAAMESIREGIVLALPGDLLRPFFERGRELMPMLLQLITGHGLCSADPSEVEFVNKVIRVCSDLHVTEVSLFSPREREIVRLLVADMNNKLIARALRISPDTVRFHLKKIYEKFGVSDRRLVADLARERHLLD
jgi:LuxR family transcriptional regulator, maltose regulon positive regulatory protein